MPTNASSEKNIKNYLYDNPELKEAKGLKACEELGDLDDDDSEIWLFQCPKNFDPHTLLGQELGKMGKNSKVECEADRFEQEKTMIVIAPEKAAEYEIICDNLKIVS